jgi:anthranilate phosphoribosyltransferase
MPVSAQLTGVSDPAVLPSLRFLAGRLPDRQVWLCHNDLGIDELVGFTDNVILREDGELRLPAGSHTSARGTLADLAVTDGDPVDQFLGVLTGRAPAPAVDAVCLNAAALAVLNGLHDDWAAAVRAAGDAMRDGTAVDLVNRMRTARATNLLAANNG